MDCPNGHGCMACSKVYVEVVDGYGADVMVYICKYCQYSYAEAE